MPDVANPSTGDVLLPLDEHVDALLQKIDSAVDFASDDWPKQAAEFFNANDEARSRIGIARRLRSLLRDVRGVERERAMVVADYDAVIVKMRREASMLDETLKAMALQHRDAKRGNFIDIPGIGRWGTRRKPDRWALNNDEVIAGMDGDDRAEFIDPGEPRPPEPKVRRDVLIERLDQMLADAMVECTSGDEDEREAFRASAAARIAAIFPGVEYIPADITGLSPSEDVIVGPGK